MEISYQELYQMNPMEARKRLIETRERTWSISQTVRVWQTSRNTVRQWVRRYREKGEAGLEDRSRKPLCSPRRSPVRVEEKVVRARRETGYGRRRLSWYLDRQGIHLSSQTIRHILRRHGFTGKRKPRRRFYPAFWVWEQEKPFSRRM